MQTQVAEFPLTSATASRTTASVPWFCLAAVFAATCIPIGALWDISWHSTIGRDTFWTPAHIMIHLGGVIPAFAASWLIFRNTFTTEENRVPGVRVWGFHGPLGAWVIVWGALAMLLSAPFDDWWHNAYGLDVEILSPPHVVLAMGMYAVAIGALLLVLSWQNRAENPKLGSLLFIYAAGVLLTMSTIIITEESYPNQQHGGTFYKVSCMIYPTYLVATARAARIRWAATGAAAVYTVLILLMNWVLPLFEARPLLAPIYNPLDRMVPPGFPLLLIVPAILIDLLMHGFRHRKGFWWDTLLALLLGLTFLGSLLAVQWPFSKFLISPVAENWFFAGNQMWPYWINMGDNKYRFWGLERNPLTFQALAIAALIACVKSRLVLGVANWMRRVQR